MLLDEGADANSIDEDGKTALMHAIIHDLEKEAKYIIRHVHIIFVAVNLRLYYLFFFRKKQI